MKAAEAKFLEFLKNSPQFVILFTNAHIVGPIDNAGNYGTISCVLDTMTRFQITL